MMEKQNGVFREMINDGFTKKTRETKNFIHFFSEQTKFSKDFE